VSGRWFPGITPSRPAPVDLDTGVPHPVRIYDYILGGKDNFAADQSAAQAAMAANPHLVTAMAEWRADDEPQPRPSPLEAGGYVAVARKD